MKLKTILNELLEQDGESDEQLAKLDRMLDSTFRNGEKNLIFRAESKFYDSPYRTREIRKDRQPKDTAIYVDAIIMAMERNLYPNAPRRRSSKFGSTVDDIEKLRMYGPNITIAFPEKGANVVSLNDDAYTEFFEPAERHFGSSAAQLINRIDSEEYPNAYDAIKDIADYYTKGRVLTFPNLMDGVAKSYNELMKELKSIQNDNEGNKYYGYTDKIIRAFNLIEKYFKTMKEGVQDGAEEILFDGEQYLIIEKEFFDQYCYWTGSEWRVEPKHMENK